MSAPIGSQGVQGMTSSVIPFTRDKIKIGLTLYNDFIKSLITNYVCAIIISLEHNDAVYGQVIDIEWQDGKKNRDILMIDSAIVSGHWFIMDSPSTSSSEKPCRLCAKMNDMDVKFCWNCGNQP